MLSIDDKSVVMGKDQPLIISFLFLPVEATAEPRPIYNSGHKEQTFTAVFDWESVKLVNNAMKSCIGSAHVRAGHTV